jgi:hypothetical protein
MADSAWAVLAALLVIGLLRPLFWWVTLSLSLWIGRKVLSDRTGRIVFGRYWSGATGWRDIL